MSRRTLDIVLATVKEQARSEKAYLGNFWAELSSTTLYVITYVAFMELLFARVGDVAGYTKNDFFLMMFIGQLTFYSVAHFLVGPMTLMIDSVRNGYFDHILLRPVSARIYLYARAVRPLYFTMVSLPNTVLFIFIINWGNLDLSLMSIVAGAVVWLCGLIVFNTVTFILAYPVFTRGDSTNMLNVYYSLISVTMMPYHKLPTVMKFLSLSFLPALLMTAGSTAVILAKGPVVSVIAGALVAAVIALVIFSRLWKIALRNYTSASS